MLFIDTARQKEARVWDCQDIPNSNQLLLPLVWVVAINKIHSVFVKYKKNSGFSVEETQSKKTSYYI